MFQSNPVTIPALPRPLRWYGTPTQWHSEAALTFSAGPRTDWFIAPEGTVTILNAPALLMPVDQPCLLSARVSAEHAATFDAGVLMVYQSDEAWAKLCLELSPQGQVMVVSVVTKGTSDDCNSVPIEGNALYLRVARLERAYAFHYSLDGLVWNLVRHFSLGASQEAEIGFIVQSPLGEGCTASFSEIAYWPQKLDNIRSGE